MQKNKSNVKRLIDNIASLGALQLLNYLAPLLLIPFLTRVLEVKEFGAVMAAMATIVIAYIITDYGFSLSLTYRISKRRENRQYINNLISVVFTAKIILSLLASVVVIIVSLLPSYYNYKKIFWMGLLAVFSQAYQPIWLFQGLEKIKNYAAYMALTKISHVFLTFLLVSISNNGFLVLLSWSISNFIGMMIGIYMLMRMGYEIRLSSFKKSIKELKKSSEFFGQRLQLYFIHQEVQ